MGENCSYSADVQDFEQWGGEPGDWLNLLHEMGVDGDKWECPHDALSDREYCPFHTAPDKLPDEISERRLIQKAIMRNRGVGDNPSLRQEYHQYSQFVGARFGTLDLGSASLIGDQMPTLWFIGATFEGDLEFHGHCPTFVASFVEIAGDMNFEGARVDSEIYLIGSTIEKEVVFSEGTVEGDANFGGVSIEGGATFDNATIDGWVDFGNAMIKDDVSFQRATIEGGALFEKATIEGRTDFWSTEIKGWAGFNSATIKGRVNFFGTTIKERCNFVEAKFEDKAIFITATFESHAHFEGATFAKGADFKKSTFYEGVHFNPLEDGETVFESGVSFAGSRVDGTADFSGTMTDDELHRTRFDKPPVFINAELTDADFSHADVTGADFTDADLTDADFTAARLPWTMLERARLSRATLFGADLRGAQLSGALFGDVRIDENTHFLGSPSDGEPSDYTLDAAFTTPCCVYESDFEAPRLPLRAIRWLRTHLQSGSTDEDPDDGPPEGVDHPESNLDKAKSTYRALEELARENARPHLQGRVFVRRQEVQRQQYGEVVGLDDASLEKRTIARIRRARASWARRVILYGESPWRVVGWALATITGFALLYPINGWMVPVEPGGVKGDPITYTRILDAGFPDGLVLLGQSFYYSTLTFTTLGFGDFRPQGFGQALTTVETALGAVMIALLVFVLGRRATR